MTCRAEPLYKYLSTGWERAFHNRLPHVLKNCAEAYSIALRSFHTSLEKRPHSQNGGLTSRLAMLARQVAAYEATFADSTSQMLVVFNERQREANREFVPVICLAMEDAYTLCNEERGKFCVFLMFL